MVSGSLKARQAAEPIALPTGNGISGVGTTAAAVGTATSGSLALDGNRKGDTTPTNVPIVPVTQSVVPSASPSDTPSGDSSDGIPVSTVVGACVGAFAGALLLICVGICIYKRSAPKPRRAQRGVGHARSASRKWEKFDSEAPDHWEGKGPQTAQVSPKSIPPMEKLDMFKKSPSVQSSFHTEDPHSADSHAAFNQYHPGLAQEMATQSLAAPEPASPKKSSFLARIETGPAISWDGSGISFGSAADGGRMSPVTSKAIPTPPATTTTLHHAQSAEVVQYDENPFEVQPAVPPPAHNAYDRKSTGNPFFGSSQSDLQYNKLQRTRSAKSNVSRAETFVSTVSSHYTDYVPPPSNKGKARAIDPASSHGHGDDDFYKTDDEDDLDGYYSASSNANPFSDPSSMPVQNGMETPGSYATAMPRSDSPSSNVTTRPPYEPLHPFANPLFQTQTTPPSPVSVSTPTSSLRRLPDVPPSPGSPPNSAATNDPVAIQGLLAALDIGTLPPAQQAALRDSGLRINSVATVNSAYSDDATIQAHDFPVPPGGNANTH